MLALKGTILKEVKTSKVDYIAFLAPVDSCIQFDRRQIHLKSNGKHSLKSNTWGLSDAISVSQI